jgi:hypothetical protein
MFPRSLSSLRCLVPGVPVGAPMAIACPGRVVSRCHLLSRPIGHRPLRRAHAIILPHRRGGRASLVRPAVVWGSLTRRLCLQTTRAETALSTLTDPCT